MTTYEWITTFLLPVTGIVSWLAGARMRRNESIKALQTTIDLLVAKNKELYDEIMTLRKEKDALREEGIRRGNEIAAMRDEGIKRDNEIAALKSELERLRK